jgi:hypothetical protein
MKTKTTYYASANNKPLALGMHGLFGRKRGFLCHAVDNPNDAALFIGFNSKKRMIRLINATIAAQSKLRRSVIFDWAAAKELIDLGVITTHKLA